eukprot:1145373-Pelagomonas_calceolata.AAC.2
MFILRHLIQAAKNKKLYSSPRLHVAFIDFKQAYNTIPKTSFGSITSAYACLRLYQDDEYVLVDGLLRASVKPARGVKQGYPCKGQFYEKPAAAVIADVYQHPFAVLLTEMERDSERQQYPYKYREM